MDIVRDDSLDLDALFGVDGPLNAHEVSLLKHYRYDEHGEEYFIVANEAGGEFSPIADGDPGGGNNPAGNHLAIFAKTIAAVADARAEESDVEGSPYESGTALVGAFVGMHELGHSLNAGKADDGFFPEPFGEVYSGTNDETPEEMITRDTRWSIMRKGWDRNTLFRAKENSYFVFSIEEASTIEGS